MKLYAYLSAFLSGALAVALGVMLYLLRQVKPVINTQTYVEKEENELKKLKVEGQGNETSLTSTLETIPGRKTKPRKILGIIKRKTKQP